MFQRAPPACIGRRRRGPLANVDQPPAQVGQCHRLPRGIDDGRDRARLGLAEAEPQLPFDIAQWRPAIERPARGEGDQQPLRPRSIARRRLRLHGDARQPLLQLHHARVEHLRGVNGQGALRQGPWDSAGLWQGHAGRLWLRFVHAALDLRPGPDGDANPHHKGQKDQNQQRHHAPSPGGRWGRGHATKAILVAHAAPLACHDIRHGRVRQGGVISAVAVGHRQAALAVMCRG